MPRPTTEQNREPESSDKPHDGDADLDLRVASLEELFPVTESSTADRPPDRKSRPKVERHVVESAAVVVAIFVVSVLVGVLLTRPDRQAPDPPGLASIPSSSPPAAAPPSARPRPEARPQSTAPATSPPREMRTPGAHGQRGDRSVTGTGRRSGDEKGKTSVRASSGVGTAQSPSRIVTETTAVTSTPPPSTVTSGLEGDRLPAEIITPIDPEVPEVGTVITPGLPPATMPEAAAVAPPTRLFEQESTSLQQVLRNYEQAYDRRDVSGTLAIWPSADARALARAFDQLEQQDLTLRNCTFAVSESDATAQCKGSLRYVRRIGNAAPQFEQHTWRIDFTRAGDTWQIVRVAAQ